MGFQPSPTVALAAQGAPPGSCPAPSPAAPRWQGRNPGPVSLAQAKLKVLGQYPGFSLCGPARWCASGPGFSPCCCWDVGLGTELQCGGWVGSLSRELQTPAQYRPPWSHTAPATDPRKWPQSDPELTGSSVPSPWVTAGPLQPWVGEGLCQRWWHVALYPVVDQQHPLCARRCTNRTRVLSTDWLLLGGVPVFSLSRREACGPPGGRG